MKQKIIRIVACSSLKKDMEAKVQMGRRTNQESRHIMVKDSTE